MKKDNQKCGTRNGNQWTEARFNSFIKGGLRGISSRWPPKYEALSGAYVGKLLNSKTNRIGKHFRCASCSGEFPAKEVQVDHIEPVIPATGFTTWDDVINRMFCEKENLQVLCTECHKRKTAEERLLAKQLKESNGS